MAKNLVIVESPAKVKTIKKFIGPSYEVMASMGHVRDLPKSSIGIDEEKIYIGEAYWVNDLQVRIYEKEEFLEKSEWEYVILMDEYYKEEGNYTPMWS